MFSIPYFLVVFSELYTILREMILGVKIRRNLHVNTHPKMFPFRVTTSEMRDIEL